MGDNRRNSSPETPVYIGFQPLLTSNQRYQIFPLINSATGSNGIDDEEIARQHQEQLYAESLMEIDEPFSDAASSFNPQQSVDIDADAAYAAQLQEEEYSRNSMVPTRSYKRELDNKKSKSVIVDSDDEPVVSDAEYAAHLQAEENQRGQRRRQRPPYRLQRPTNRTFQSNEPEVIPIPPFARPARNSSSSSENDTNISNLFQLFTSRGLGVQLRGFPRSNRRGSRDIQSNNADFGPNDYEQLLELDNAVGSNSLSKEQINRLPTEKFQRPKNTNDEENKCSICWEEFEQNQIVRRLPCLHLYHRDCIDNWLKSKNQCPVCRIPPFNNS